MNQFLEEKAMIRILDVFADGLSTFRHRYFNKCEILSSYGKNVKNLWQKMGSRWVNLTVRRNKRTTKA
uniref:Uncharacterized protein n=1 Tax=Meloidogyne hapla TaxID=6305 RepID=A0A1I8B6F3_MELHA